MGAAQNIKEKITNKTYLLLVESTLWKMTVVSISGKKRASQKFRGETSKLISPLEIVAWSVGDKAVLAQ